MERASQKDHDAYKLNDNSIILWLIPVQDNKAAMKKERVEGQDKTIDPHASFSEGDDDSK